MTRPIPHGTYKGYRIYMCRQQCCKRAASRYAKTIRVGIALGTWNPWGDTDQARTHLRMLYTRGWTAEALSRRTGHAATTFRSLWIAPHERKSRTITDALMAVSLDEQPDQAAVYLTSRRLRVLARQGWGVSALETRLGVDERELNKVRLAKTRTTTRSIADTILSGYEELRDVASPSPRAPAVAKRALARGWLSDIEWDGLIDLPDQELRAELDRQVSLLEPEDLAAAHTAYGHHKERSLLVVAAASEYNRRQWAARKERTCA